VKSKIDAYNEINTHLLEDDIPSKYIEEMMKEEVFYEYPYSMISDLRKVMQSKKFHPEGDVLSHTLMVVDEAAKRKHESKNQRVLMWSALLHDIGKAPTTKERNGKITSYNHEKVGSTMAKQFLLCLTNDNEFIDDVSSMVRWHMEALFVIKNLPFANTKKMLEEVPLEEIALLNLCDRLGRGEMTREKVEGEIKGIDEFIEKCKKIK
jgi:putative nucleotidyltransferase with HDIG domain